jgi:hypothetical protein
MKYTQTFESFLNEAKKPRITINADLWKGQTPVIRKDSHGDQYIFYSGDVLGGQYDNFLDKPNVVLIVVEASNRDKNKLYIKVGYGSESDSGEKRYRRSIGDVVETSPEELKADPKGIAKKVADNFVAAKKSFDMNFWPYDDDAIFKIEKDVEKPALEVIEFATKNLI